MSRAIRTARIAMPGATEPVETASAIRPALVIHPPRHSHSHRRSQDVRGRRLTSAVVIVHTLAVVCTTGFVRTLQLMDYPMVARLRAGASEQYMATHNDMFRRVLAPGLFTAGATALLLLVLRPEKHSTEAL
ncbi:hypothetical protein [Streptomyces sp. Ac-502]|uniref:hypothetical protein n=1 Tax=Streptomyces sp. Ac-502 TaxID=3342801 RepID=UPI0038622A16